MFGEISPKFRGINNNFAFGLTGTPFEITVSGTYPNYVLSFPSILHTANSTVLDDGSSNMSIGGNLTVNGLTASQAVVTNASKELISLAYGSANTSSTLVERDSSGNFSAGTITASLTGLASLNLPLAGGTMTGNLILNGDATMSLQAVTYEQLLAVIAGLIPKPPCYAATTANLTSWTYNNASSGIGATLTAPSTGVFTTDGTTPPVGSAILVNNQTTTFQNGIYSLTTSSSGADAVLTRATYYDTPAQIQMGDYFPVENGTLYAGTFWYQTSSVVTIGMSAITFTQFNLILAGTGLTKTGNTISLTNPVALNLGGTNAVLTASNGGIFYSTATAGAILSGTATAGQLLTSGASSTPAWTTSTYPATNAVNTLLYASSANVMAALATGNNGVLITSSGGVPSISSTLPAAVQANITQLGTIAAPLLISESGTSPMITATQTTNANANFIEFSNPNAGSGLKGYIGLDGIGMLGLSTDSMVIASDTSGTQNILLVAGGSRSYNLNLQPNGVIFTGGGSTLDDGSGNITAFGSVAALDTTGFLWKTAGGTTVYKSVSSNSGGLTFTDVANTLTTLTIGTNGSLTALNNILDNAAHGCQFGTSGAASMIFGNGASPSTFDMRGTFEFGQGDPASGGSFNVASSSSITAAKSINIGNNTATPSTTTILGAVIINNAGSQAIGIGTGSYSGTITIGNASSVIDINSPITLTKTLTLNPSSGNAITVSAGLSSLLALTATGVVNINTSGSANTSIGTSPYSGSIVIGNGLVGSVTSMGGNVTFNAAGLGSATFDSGLLIAGGLGVSASTSGSLFFGDTTNTTTNSIQSTTSGTINVGTNLVGGTLNLGHINTNAVGGVGGVVNIEGGLVFGFPTAYSTGTASTSGASTTVTGSGTTWNTNMIGGIIMVTSGADIGAQVGITAVGSTTSLTTDAPITIASGSSYIIYFLSHQISSRSVSLCTSGNQTSFTVGTNTYSGPITLGNSIDNGGIISLLTDSSGKVITANNTLDGGIGTASFAGLVTASAGLTITGTTTLNSLTASEAVVTNGSNQLASLAYTNANTASTLVQRDSSGNFSAGTITASLTGHASLDLALTGGTLTGALTGTSASFPSGVTANVSGNLTGTVLTAAQGDITSLGTLTSLDVSGSVTFASGSPSIGAIQIATNTSGATTWFQQTAGTNWTQYSAAATTVTANWVAAGLGSNSNFKITPSGTGMVFVVMPGLCLQTNGDDSGISIWWGTGTPPSQGTNLSTYSGAVQGIANYVYSVSSTQYAAFYLPQLVKLTVGTAYWFDMGYYNSSGSGSTTLARVQCQLSEI